MWLANPPATCQGFSEDFKRIPFAAVAKEPATALGSWMKHRFVILYVVPTVSVCIYIYVYIIGRETERERDRYIYI
jgi:hypothetical protein